LYEAAGAADAIAGSGGGGLCGMMQELDCKWLYASVPNLAFQQNWQLAWPKGDERRNGHRNPIP